MKTSLLLAVSALLVLKTSCEVLKEESRVVVNGKEMTEEITLDTELQQQVVRIVDAEDDSKGDVRVFDYKRRMTAMYVADSDVCYVKSGLGPEDQSPFEKDANGEPTETESVSYLRKADEKPTHDVDVLPESLRPQCKGKDIYWLEKAAKGDEDTEGAVSKRGYCYFQIRYIEYCCSFWCSFSRCRRFYYVWCCR